MMSDRTIDEEVRMAETMALAVASAPNLRAAAAKKMVSKTQKRLSASLNGSGSSHKRSSLARQRRSSEATATNVNASASANANQSQDRELNFSDLEVQRAREMALAVAALGTETKNGPMKAEDIRMAVANVLSDPNERRRKSRTTGSIRTQQSQQLQKHGMKLTPGREPPTKGGAAGGAIKETTTKSDNSQIRTMVEKMMRPPWILRNQSLFATIALANFLLLYVTLSSEPSYTKISNAVFIFNTAVSFFCAMEKKNPQNLTAIDSSMVKDRTNADTDGACASDDEDSNNARIQKREEALVDEMEKRLRPETSITLEWLPDVHYSEVDLQALLDLQPESTLAERRRFLKARKGVIKAASAQLGSYLQWRSANKIDEFFPSTFTTDDEDWALAARGAMEIANNTKGPSLAANGQRSLLPRIVSVFGGDDGLVLCKNGARIVHVLPSQLDTTIAPSTTYALALAMYLDRKLDRKHTEKVTVVIDIRSGKGWPNPSSVSLVPFIKLVVGSLNSYFPERLSRCILFPLPMTATVLFNKAKAYLDPDTATKIQVCSGAGSVSAKVPTKVGQFIDEKSIAAMEERRLAMFLP
ncbi:unnamed protein product [Pseudo-nitzschia multistriata]|uniref:CRAL-TRIO domain-containing protein n=1 Tax=Pseudo-nitzschia multistriata TaxID=183589 RepID=A0A448YZX8_9STRA|nr:unnamed protein product [Pseudo-nitzschia multistriata]